MWALGAVLAAALGTGMGQSCGCDCGLLVTAPGLLVLDSWPCPQPFARWTLSLPPAAASPPTQISLKLMSLSQGQGDLLVVFDGPTKGSPILFDSRIPDKFSRDVVSTDGVLHLEHHTRSLNRTSLIATGAAADKLQGTVIAYDFTQLIEQPPVSDHDPIATLLGICGFTGAVLLAMLLLYFCCFRGAKVPSSPARSSRGTRSRDASTHCDTVGIRRSAAARATPSEEEEEEDPTIASHSIPMLELHALPPHLFGDSRSVGTQLRSPALLLRHVAASSTSSGRGESPLSFGAATDCWDSGDGLDFYDTSLRCHDSFFSDAQLQLQIVTEPADGDTICI